MSGKSNVPIEVFCKCAKCGANANITRYIRLSDSAYLQGYLRDDKGSAAVRANNRELLGKATQLKRNRPVLLDADGRPASMTCPCCGITNLPDAGCRRALLIPESTRMKASFLTFVYVVTASFIVASWLPVTIPINLYDLGGKISSTYLLQVTAVYAVLMILLLISVLLAQRAYNDPAMLEKKFRSVLNKEVYANMRKFNMGDVHIGCKRD
jgi:hypothetical protein